MDSFWVKNFTTFFLLRYGLFCVSLVTLQHLHIFQIFVLLVIQGVYFGFFARLILKRRIFEEKKDYVFFFVQEFGLIWFMVMALVLQYMQ